MMGARADATNGPHYGFGRNLRDHLIGQGRSVCERRRALARSFRCKKTAGLLPDSERVSILPLLDFQPGHPSPTLARGDDRFAVVTVKLAADRDAKMLVAADFQQDYVFRVLD